MNPRNDESCKLEAERKISQLLSKKKTSIQDEKNMLQYFLEEDLGKKEKHDYFKICT